MNKTYCTGLFVLAFIASSGVRGADVHVDAANPRTAVADVAFGIHTSVYANQFGNPALPDRLIESGVHMLRYPGGGYADVFHWSIARAQWLSGITGGGLSPWWGEPANFGYVAANADFGTFIGLLDASGSQAVITVNYGSALKFVGGQSLVPDYGGQPKEAAAWVAYANSDPALYNTPADIVIGVDQQGNDWKTAGYWAKLRASTPGEYVGWSSADGVYDPYNEFLAIDRDPPVGIQYWEIGNETFGTGYYDSTGNGYSVDYDVPYPWTETARSGHPDLSPAQYGQEVNEYAAAMRAIDPSIKIGAVVTTPPGDYSWDEYGSDRWSDQVLQQCATNIDFVISHWYPWAGNDADGSALLAAVGATLPAMIDGATPNVDSGTDAGVRDWINTYRPDDGTNVQIFITEFNYFGNLVTSVRGPGNALFAADSYATWIGLGVANIDYLEMSKMAFLSDTSSLTRGAVFYAIQMVNRMADANDVMLDASSDSSLLRAHAALQQDGDLGLLLLNEDPNDDEVVNVTVSGPTVTHSGTKYEFGIGNFPPNSETPSSGPSATAVSGLGNSFSLTVPAYSMVVLTVPASSIASNTPPVFQPISNRVTGAGQTVALTAVASDTDLPAQTLTFSLLSAPAHASLDSLSGHFSWRPWVTQADTTNLVTLKVVDNGSPSLSATQSLTITVSPLANPALEMRPGSNGVPALIVNGDAGPDYAVLASTNLLDWEILLTTNSPPLPLMLLDGHWTEFPERFYRVLAGPPLP